MKTHRKQQGQEKSKSKTRIATRWYVLLAILAFAGVAEATPWTYEFKNGWDPYFWIPDIYGNSLFTYTTTETGLKVAGGWGGSGYQSGRLYLNLGSFPGGLTDFDATVAFTNAAFTVGALHQIQFEMRFPEPKNPLGYTLIVIVKDPDDFHVWRDPPQSEVNHTYTSATSGKMRIVRSGTSIATYLNDNPTPLWSGNYGTNALDYFSLTINKNFTSAATEVTWTDFSITPAPVPNPVITTCGLTNGTLSMGWSGTAQIPATVERATSLSVADWLVISSNNTNRAFIDTAPPTGRGFYRVKAPVD